MAAVEDADGSLSGATLELAGPTDYSRAELAAFVGRPDAPPPAAAYAAWHSA